MLAKIITFESLVHPRSRASMLAKNAGEMLFSLLTYNISMRGRTGEL